MYVIAMKLVIYRYENSLLSTVFAVIVYRVKENGSIQYFPLPNPKTHARYIFIFVKCYIDKQISRL